MSTATISLGHRLGLVAISVLFCVMGMLHFSSPDDFVKSMPPYLPAALALVWWATKPDVDVTRLSGHRAETGRGIAPGSTR